MQISQQNALSHHTIEGHFKGSGNRIGIVVARFNELITRALLSGALDCLHRHGVEKEDITVVYVPGGLEIPLAIQKMAQSRKYNALIALGAVIRGATAHFEYVSSFATQATAQAGLEAGLPVMNGILTVENIEQSLERAGSKAGNKGWECAQGALEMIDVLRQIN